MKTLITLITVTVFLAGCGPSCYTWHGLNAKMEEGTGCQDLGADFWPKEGKILYTWVCTGGEGGDWFYHFEKRGEMYCELKYMREQI